MGIDGLLSNSCFQLSVGLEPLSPKEQEWIVQVIKALIRRKGELAYGHKMKLN